jgi:hypothetical protein
MKMVPPPPSFSLGFPFPCTLQALTTYDVQLSLSLSLFYLSPPVCPLLRYLSIVSVDSLIVAVFVVVVVVVVDDFVVVVVVAVSMYN